MNNEAGNRNEKNDEPINQNYIKYKLFDLTKERSTKLVLAKQIHQSALVSARGVQQ